MHKLISGIIKPSQVLVSGPHIENLEKWREIGAAITEENGEVTRIHLKVNFLWTFSNDFAERSLQNRTLSSYVLNLTC